MQFVLLYIHRKKYSFAKEKPDLVGLFHYKKFCYAAKYRFSGSLL